MSKKPISSSNLALRFYSADGWTKKELKECIRNFGSVEEVDFDSAAIVLCGLAYYRFSNPCDVDLDKLAEKCSILYRAFNDYPDETDKQFMARHL